ncbi:MAG: type II secretion system protein [Phycisphaerales bacterium]|nr:type II secretion system protein [Phycisphaerales bacterium]
MIIRRGFTLIEVIVVTVLMAMLAIVLVSRLTGAANREFDLASERVSDLLLMFAMRSEFADEPVGILLDPERNSLRLVVRRGERGEFNDGWEYDTSVQEIRLPTFIEGTSMEFSADGDSVDPADRPLTNLPGQPRPRIEVSMQSTDYRNPRSVQFILPSNSWRPIRMDSIRNESIETISRTPVDLDKSGSWQEDW